MNAKIGLVDCRVRPRNGDQLVLAHELTGARHKSDQDMESATPDSHRLVIFQQQALSRKEAEGAKQQ
jgi:hypothetical protein